jgi:hypothetical protein
MPVPVLNSLPIRKSLRAQSGTAPTNVVANGHLTNGHDAANGHEPVPPVVVANTTTSK